MAGARQRGAGVQGRRRPSCSRWAAHWAAVLFAAPTIVKRLVDHAVPPALGTPVDGAAKTIVYGGAPMYVADIQRALRVMGPRFVQIYGQGETPMTHRAVARAR
jgi:acyl-CoA synthetase (AMP-forming)/AMP-acid ligase II